LIEGHLEEQSPFVELEDGANTQGPVQPADAQSITAARSVHSADVFAAPTGKTHATRGDEILIVQQDQIHRTVATLTRRPRRRKLPDERRTTAARRQPVERRAAYPRGWRMRERRVAQLTEAAPPPSSDGMARVALLAVAILAVACGQGSYRVEPSSPAVATQSGERLRVMLPAPGSQGEGPGREVSGRIIAVLQQSYADVQLLPTADRAAALDSAGQAKAQLLIQPAITTWVVSSAPPFTADQIGVRLELLDVSDGGVVRTATFENVSPLWSISRAGPVGLLDQRFDTAVRDLVGTPSAR
jgi:hypothetical protein